jgi:hypothetical protein
VAPEPPIRRRLLVTDATYEALHRILAENEHGIFVIWDELAGLLELFERDGRQGERQLFLTAWNGKGNFAVDRIGRGTLHARSVCLSLFGNLLPGRVERLVAAAHSGDLRSDGLLQRLQVLVWPDVRRDFCLVDRPANEEASFLMATLAHRFVELEGTELVFTDPAQLLFNDWLCELELKLRSGSGVLRDRLPEPAGKGVPLLFICLRPVLAHRRASPPGCSELCPFDPETALWRHAADGRAAAARLQ